MANFLLFLYGCSALLINDYVHSIPHGTQRGLLVIKGLHFENPRQKVFDGSCCDHYRKAPTCRGSCNTLLRICATESQRPPPSKNLAIKKFPINLSSLLSSGDSPYHNQKPQKRLHHKRWSYKRLPHGSRFPSVIKKNQGKTLSPRKLSQISQNLSLARKLSELSEVKISMSSSSSSISTRLAPRRHMRNRRDSLASISTDIAENQVEPVEAEHSLALGNLVPNIEILRPPFFDGSGKETSVTKTREDQEKLEKTQNPNLVPFEPCSLGEVITDILWDGSNGTLRQHNDLEVDFSFSTAWPITFNLIIEAWHIVDDATEENLTRLTQIDQDRRGVLITRHVGKHALNGGSAPRSFKRSLEQGRELKYSIKVKCKTPYLGRKCSQRCETLLRSQTSRLNCTSAGEVTCLSGWTGDLCNRPQCRKGCHKVHGYCTQPGECKCALGWRGKNCDECVPLPGCKHGFCKTKSYECICDQGWDGSYCSMPVCRNGCHNTRGYCKLPGECRCRIGWSGSTCEECKSLPGCAHGYCTKPLECRCKEGWTGIHCDQPICRAKCSEQFGSCTRPGDCRCKVGWWGNLCNTCFPYPGCKHGTCVQPWECNCKPGWRGMNCDKDDHFKSYCKHHGNTCQNGGTCNDVLNGLHFTCSCPSLFTGRRCEYREPSFPIFNRGAGRIYTLAVPVTSTQLPPTQSTTQNTTSTTTTTTTPLPVTAPQFSTTKLEKSISSSISHESESREKTYTTKEVPKPKIIVINMDDDSDSTQILEIIADQDAKDSMTATVPSVPSSTEIPDSEIEASEERYFHLKMEPLPIGKHMIGQDELSIAEENVPEPEKVERRTLENRSNLDFKRVKYLHSVKKHDGGSRLQTQKRYIQPMQNLNSKPRSQTATLFIPNVSRLGDILAANLRRHALASGKNTKITAYKSPTITKDPENITEREVSKKSPLVFVDINNEAHETPGDEIPRLDNPRVNHIDQRARFLRHHDSVGLPPETRVHTTYYPMNQIKFVTQDDIPKPSSLNINPFVVDQRNHHGPHLNDFGSSIEGPSSPPATERSFFVPQSIGKFVSHEDHEAHDASEQSQNLEVPELSYFEENYAGRVHIGALGKHAPLEEVIRAYIELKKLVSS